MKCEDIQDVLFDYMARELGSGRSDLIREHLRKCEACQAAAADVQATLDVLRHDASETKGSMPSRLSDARRARLVRALAHPLLNWVYTHHILVSILVAAVVLAVAVGVLRRIQAWKIEKPEGISVTIGRGRPGGAPGRPDTPPDADRGNAKPE